MSAPDTTRRLFNLKRTFQSRPDPVQLDAWAKRACYPLSPTDPFSLVVLARWRQP